MRGLDLPDIKVKLPGSTTPADVFSTVPLAEDTAEGGCQEEVLVCTCMDTKDEDGEGEGMDWVLLVRLDMVKVGLIRSCREK